MTQDTADFPQQLEHLMAVLRQNETATPSDAASPMEKIAQEFFANNWAECADGLLQKTSLLRVIPELSAAPRAFRFELDRPFKRKTGPDAPVDLQPGPIRGLIRYRSDLFVNPAMPYIAVQIDPDLSYLHPNCSRQRASLVCLGPLPDNLFPYPLGLLLETRLYPILTYQDRKPSDPADLEAARYFALHPEAMDGLEPVEPLY